MELDDLKLAWQTLGSQLERQQYMQWQSLRAQALDRARSQLSPLLWGQVAQVLLGIGLVVLGIACWSRAPGATSLLFANGIAVHVFGVLNIILAGITIGQARNIDYSAPVLEIQRRNARLLRVYLLNGNLCGLAWWMLWMPVTIAFASLAWIDLTRQAPGFIWSGLVVSVAGLVATWCYLRRPGGRRAVRTDTHGSVGDGGDGIRRAQRILDEVARFERD